MGPYTVCLPTKKGIPSTKRRVWTHDSQGMVILLSILLALLGFLIWERILVIQIRKKIPLVITVTGTRGKSSVARSLGAVLREDGRRVLVKTTGTEARFVLPDGSIEEIRRRRLPTVLEQKSVLRKAVKCGAKILVSEIMSIEPENHVVESHGILRPDIVLITNVRLDHIESMGTTLEQIGRTFTLDMVPGSTVFALEGQSALLRVPPGVNWREVPLRPIGPSGIPQLNSSQFPQNDALVAEVARSLDIGVGVIQRGLQNCRTDRGGFAVWSYSIGGKTVHLVNAFAANDPESSAMLLDRAQEVLGESRRVYGLFALRDDRMDRTHQWIDALRCPRWSVFERIFLAGDVSHAVSRAVKGSVALKGRDPRAMTEWAVSQMDNQGLLFGFGNTHGIGLQLIDHWNNEGNVYGT